MSEVQATKSLGELHNLSDKGERPLPHLSEPIRDQFAAFLPLREIGPPWGSSHRYRVPNRVVFEEFVQVLVSDSPIGAIADNFWSATAVCRRQDECISSAILQSLQEIVLDALDRTIGLELADVAVRVCLTKTPCRVERAGEHPAEREDQSTKRFTFVDSRDILLGFLHALANRHNSPLLDETLDTLKALGPLSEQMRLHLERGYDSQPTRQKLEVKGFVPDISEKGKPVSIQAGE